MLRKRSLIETVNAQRSCAFGDQLQNISQIVHSRHRSPINFLVNTIAGLIAYTWQDKKQKLQERKRPDKFIICISNLIFFFQVKINKN